MTTVRDCLRKNGRKPLYGSWGESADCNIVYRGGIPRAYVSNHSFSNSSLVVSSRLHEQQLVARAEQDAESDSEHERTAPENKRGPIIKGISNFLGYLALRSAIVSGIKNRIKRHRASL